MLRNSIENLRLAEQFLRQSVKLRPGAQLPPDLIGVKQIARAAQITEQTAFRWVRGQQAPSEQHLHLLTLHANGRVMPEHFERFQFREGYLWFDNASWCDPRRLRAFLTGLY
jgi:hypothetical protein